MTMVNWFSKNKVQNGRKKSKNIQKCLQRCDPTLDTTYNICPLYAKNSHNKETLSFFNNTRKHEKNISIPWKASDNFLVFLPSLRLGQNFGSYKKNNLQTVSVSVHAGTHGEVSSTRDRETGSRRGCAGSPPWSSCWPSPHPYQGPENMRMTFVFLAPLS